MVLINDIRVLLFLVVKFFRCVVYDCLEFLNVIRDLVSVCCFLINFCSDENDVDRVCIVLFWVDLIVCIFCLYFVNSFCSVLFIVWILGGILLEDGDGSGFVCFVFFWELCWFCLMLKIVVVFIVKDIVIMVKVGNCV